MRLSLFVVGAVVRGFAPVGVARPAVGRLGASKDEEAIGKQAKGFYIRPSAAIERGGGFFVPGLEGTKLRVALGGGLVGLVARALLRVLLLFCGGGRRGARLVGHLCATLLIA